MASALFGGTLADFDRSATVAAQEAITRRVVGAFFDVYNALGYGFLEAVYARALGRELRDRRIAVQRGVAIEVAYKGAAVGVFRADMLVEACLVLELKATPTLTGADRAQLLNYLRASGLECGLLLHFGPEPSFRRVFGLAPGTARRESGSGQKQPITTHRAATAKIPREEPSRLWKDVV